MFARRHDIIVVHDNAYSEITYDGYRAPSFLETPGATDVGIEVFSLSKTYNMTGWRAGAVVGNADLVGAYWQLKTNIDSGMFEAVQEASAAALRSDQTSVAEMCAIYRRRRDVLVDALRRDRPARQPAEGRDLRLGARARRGDLGVVHREGAGGGGRGGLAGRRLRPRGEGFVRMSLTVPDARLNEAADRIAAPRRLGVGGPDLPVHRLRPEAVVPSGPTPATPGSTWSPSRRPDSPPGARAGAHGPGGGDPAGHAGLVLPRSGLARRHGVTLANSPGLIDAGYRGELTC